MSTWLLSNQKGTMCKIMQLLPPLDLLLVFTTATTTTTTIISTTTTNTTANTITTTTLIPTTTVRVESIKGKLSRSVGDFELNQKMPYS